MDSTEPATIGHNSGALDLTLALDPTQLLSDLQADAQPLFIRKEELIAAFSRFQAATADGIPDEETQARAGDFVRQIAAHVVVVDARRTAIKKPVLEAQRIIDEFFKRDITDPLDAAKRAVLAKVTAFLHKQQQEEAARRRAEAERQRAEAERLAAEAERTASPRMMERALEAEEKAWATGAAPVKVEAVRSDLGTTISSRRGPWKMRVTDISKIPHAYLLPNEPVLIALAKTHATSIEAGTQPIEGVEFYRDVTANIR